MTRLRAEELGSDGCLDVEGNGPRNLDKWTFDPLLTSSFYHYHSRTQGKQSVLMLLSSLLCFLGPSMFCLKDSEKCELGTNNNRSVKMPSSGYVWKKIRAKNYTMCWYQQDRAHDAAHIALRLLMTDGKVVIKSCLHSIFLCYWTANM